VIRGYRAVIDPAAIGLGFEVLVHVTMDREDAATIADYENGLAEVAEVRPAERLFGDPDYLIRVATVELAARAPAHLYDRDETHRRRATLSRLGSPCFPALVIDQRRDPVVVDT
jgi:DNA-binding Lrp family transcriptional regulator